MAGELARRAREVKEAVRADTETVKRRRDVHRELMVAKDRIAGATYLQLYAAACARIVDDAIAGEGTDRPFLEAQLRSNQSMVGTGVGLKIIDFMDGRS